MKAIVMQEEKRAEVVNDRSKPQLRPGYLLVKVKAVALNPTDWKHIAFMNTPGALSGCDYAGVVEQTGTEYQKKWKVGDRIAGFAHGGNENQKEDGAFAEYIVAKADTQARIPDSMSFEEAATLGVGCITCGQGLYQALGLNLPDNPIKVSKPLLIYGGSTATGSLGIQFAKLSGYKVITTCSPRNFDYVKSLGADEVFDYNDGACAANIKKAAGDKLEYAWDTISTDSSAQICSDSIAAVGKYRSLLDVPSFKRDDVSKGFTLGYTAMGEPVNKSAIKFKKDDTREDFEFARTWMQVVDRLLAEGKVKPHTPKVDKTGLDGVLQGLEMLRQDKVSGQKLVYTLE